MTAKLCSECGKPQLPGAPDGVCPSCLLQLALLAAPCRGDRRAATLNESDLSSTAAMPGPVGFNGRYQLLEIIGEGGFGTVWMAEQQMPVRRKVALKIIKLGMDTRQVVARFEAEQQALALMDHANIARVFDAGSTDSGRPFFAMELVRGIRITEFCDANQLNTRQRIELCISICQAVQHAHQKGVIHRDLKPSNILVTEQDGRPVPKIIDFGVAKAIEEPLTAQTVITRFHQFLGTPAYMSPEQAGLGGLDIDTRSDIYSLGVLIYELLTGRTPFDQSNHGKETVDCMLRTIREREPLRPSTRISTLSREDLCLVASRRREDPARLHKLVRGDLDWIVLKALEKDRARRYQSANGLAADLRRYLENEPITARPPSTLYRLRQFVRRKRLLVAAASAVLLALIIGLVATAWQAFRANKNLVQARLNAYASEMNVAQQALMENNLPRARELVSRQTDDLRGFEWRYLWQNCQDQSLTNFPTSTDGLQSAIAFSPDGRHFVHSGHETVVVREARTWRVLTELRTMAHTVSFSPDGSILITSTFFDKGRVQVWNTATWSEMAAPPLTNACAPARFSSDGQWLITGMAQHRRLQLWNATNFHPVASCPETPVYPQMGRSVVAFSPDSKIVMTSWLDFAGRTGGIRLWTVPAMEHYRDLFRPESPANSAAFLPDGNHVVTGSWVSDLMLWNLAVNPAAVIRVERAHSAYLTAISVSGATKKFATAGGDQTICLWDSSTFTRLTRWRGHTREINALATSPDGEFLASSSRDGTVRLWRTEIVDTGETWSDGGVIAGYSANGRTLVLGPTQGDYRWQVIAGTNRVVIPISPDPPLQFQFDITPHAVTGPEPLAALGRTMGRIELWDLGARQLRAHWTMSTNLVTAVAFSPNGGVLATADESGWVKLWDVATQRQIGAFRASRGMVGLFAFAPDGNALVTGSSLDRHTRLWNLQTLQKIRDLEVSANFIAFAPDGKHFVTCSVGGNDAQLWQFPSCRPAGAFKGHVGGVNHVAFSPDGRTLATGAYDGRIKLWNMATQQEVATLPHPGVINALRFSPDGRALAASFWDFPHISVQFYRAPSLDEIAARESTPTQKVPWTLLGDKKN